ncbi:TMV resistance protein N-like isoform X2 [Punica granatum]|uniref:TMV resistance protein N-like isoform X2 n=1 Tax=Punica granatum TaxID=22663 RepID=A0A6P8CL06_PUNGR|nr:TMV resistance protein N-like isoform X2 [Punica granatum]
MHDLIRDMGREIVKERCPSNPGKRSRLWFQEDVLLTLQNHLVTEEVEGIALNSPELRTVKVNAEAFVRMNRLRLLRLDNMHVSGEYRHMPKNLRWLYWHKVPLSHITDDFTMERLVVIDLQYNNLREVWKNSKFLGHLKVLNLSYSSLLTQNPDYSKLPNLEELILRDCSKLAEVHSSIGCLERLVSLNLKNCKSLIEIPSSICRLKSLKILDISSCPNINWLSEDFGDMVSLTEFLAEGTGITRVPFSATRLTNLMNVSFSVCKEQMTRSISSLIWSLVWPRSASRAKNVQIDCLFQLRSLRTLRLAYCSLSDESIPKEGLGSLQLLENLELSGNWFSSLPDTIRGLLSSRNLYWMIAQISSHFQACPQVLLSCRQLTAYHWKARAIVRLEWCENIAGDAQENFMLGVQSGGILLPDI